MSQRSRPGPTAIRRYGMDCDGCPELARLTFYDQAERDSFARRHVLANTAHSITMNEETIGA